MATHSHTQYGHYERHQCFYCARWLPYGRFVRRHFFLEILQLLFRLFGLRQQHESDQYDRMALQRRNI